MIKRMRDDAKMVLEQDPAARTTSEIITIYADLHAVWSHLITRRLYNERHYILVRVISQVLRSFTGIEIHPGMKIGKRLFIDHGMGVAIGETCTIRDNVAVYQGMTLGDTDKQKGERRLGIGDNTLTAAGSGVLESIQIDSNASIDVNLVILQSVPGYTAVVDIPGYIVKQEGKRVGKASDHCNLPDPLFGQTKQLKRQLEKARNGETKDDYII